MIASMTMYTAPQTSCWSPLAGPGHHWQTDCRRHKQRCNKVARNIFPLVLIRRQNEIKKYSTVTDRTVCHPKPIPISSKLANAPWERFLFVVCMTRKQSPAATIPSPAAIAKSAGFFNSFRNPFDGNSFSQLPNWKSTIPIDDGRQWKPTVAISPNRISEIGALNFSVAAIANVKISDRIVK